MEVVKRLGIDVPALAAEIRAKGRLSGARAPLAFLRAPAFSAAQIAWADEPAVDVEEDEMPDAWTVTYTEAYSFIAAAVFNVREGADTFVRQLYAL